jgi:hypothetical protein
LLQNGALRCGDFLGRYLLFAALRHICINRAGESRPNRREKKMNMRSKLLIASIFAGLVASTGIAAAQVVDDPPGSAYQTQGIREWNGQRATPSVFSRTARAAAAAAHDYYAYISAPPVRGHKVVQSSRANASRNANNDIRSR